MYPLKKATIYYCDRAPTQVRVEVTLQSSKEEIYDVLVDTPSWTEWYVGMKYCENILRGNPDSDGDTVTATCDSTIVGRKVEVGSLIAEEEFISLQQPKTTDKGQSAHAASGAAWVWAFCVCKTNMPLFKTMVERVVLNEEEAGYETTKTIGTDTSTGDTNCNKKINQTKVVYKAGIEFTWLGTLLKPIIVKATYDSWYKSLTKLDQHILNKKL